MKQEFKKYMHVKSKRDKKTEAFYQFKQELVVDKVLCKQYTLLWGDIPLLLDKVDIDLKTGMTKFLKNNEMFDIEFTDELSKEQQTKILVSKLGDDK